MIRLPRAGRRGRLPPWPLLDDVKLTAQLNRAKADRKACLRDLGDPDLDKRTRATLNRKLGRAIEVIDVLTVQLRHMRKLERDLWAELWRTPQAVMWDRGHATPFEVAQYARLTIMGQLGELDATKEARQWSDRLGLNAQAMQRLRWEVEPLEEATTVPAGPSTPGGQPAGGARARYGHLRLAAGQPPTDGPADAVAGT
jgi:hypothetical protein